MATDKHDEDEEGLDLTPEIMKRKLFAAWTEVHPSGTAQQFEAEWKSTTTASQPSNATDMSLVSEDRDPVIIKRRMFEEWRALRPNGTHEQFDAEWDAVTTRD